jgi:hypothetical protein
MYFANMTVNRCAGEIVEDKVKQSRYTPWRRLGGEEVQLLLILDLGNRRGVSGQRHAPAALFPTGKGPPVPIVQEAGWAPVSVWTQRIEEKSFAPAGIEPRSPGRPARSQTL